MLGVAVDAAFTAEGARSLLTAHFFSRGELVYSMVLARPARLPGYARVFERILASVRPVEPRMLREARGRALLAPESFPLLLALAEVERRAGNLQSARAALDRAAVREPERAEPLVQLASLAFLEGLPREGCAHAARARELGPPTAAGLGALASCALSRGDEQSALQRLEEASRLSPGDQRILERIERLRRRMAR